MDVLSEFARIASEPYYERLKKWKQDSGKKVMGCAGLYVPEEMIFAFGMLPVVLFDGKEPITEGSRHWQSNFCAPVRGLTDLACKGQLDFLDGLVIHDCCHELRGAVDVIRLNAPRISWLKPMWFPKVLKQRQTKARTIEELNIFKNSLEAFTGQQMAVASLQKSIRVYNENRALLLRLYDIRRSKPGILSAKHIQNIVIAGMQMPKDEHSKLLKKLLSDLKTSEAPEDDRPKLVLSGSLCDELPDEIFDIIETAGAIIVDDDLYVGSRYFLTQAEDLNDPVEALANRYIHMISPCPTTQDPSNDLGKYIVNMAQRSHAQGVINIITKFCEAHCHIYPWIRFACQDAGIPELMIETEHGLTSIGQIKTRIQAFIEMIKGK